MKTVFSEILEKSNLKLLITIKKKGIRNDNHDGKNLSNYVVEVSIAVIGHSNNRQKLKKDQ